MESVSRLGPFEENTIVVGDCLDIMAQMPDGCVDLVVTDPVYDDIETQRQMAKELPRILRPQGSLILWAAHSHLAELLPAISRYLDYRWLFVERITGANARMFQLRLFVKWKPIVWFSRGRGLRTVWIPDLYSLPRNERVNHKWAKSEASTSLWVRSFSKEGEMVFDPFIGSGTTAVVADRLGRKFFGCDINPDYVEMALGRLEKDRAGRQLELL